MSEMFRGFFLVVFETFREYRQHFAMKIDVNANMFGGSLESLGCFWLFCTKNLGGGGDLEIVILLEKNCSFSGADNVKWWGHSNTTSW